MSDDRTRVVIIGGGLAGASCVDTLVSRGFSGTITMLCEEPVLPYHRPPLSKDFLGGQMEVDELYVHPESFYAKHKIDVRLETAARSIDVEGQGVELDDGSWLPYDWLVLATGSAARSLDVAGSDSASVLSLRTAADAERLRERLDDAERVVVIGAGWIGTEVAAWSTRNGAHVVLVDPLGTPLERILGPDVGQRVGELHTTDGVELRMQTSIASFDLGPDGELRAAVTSTGEHIECDLAVVAIGVEPRDEIAAAGGLSTPNGIAVDESLLAQPAILGVGDVALHAHPLFGPIRVEHWGVARNHGQAAAATIIDGTPEPYNGIPYFMSRQHDTLLEYWGHAARWDEVVIRDGDQPGTLTALYVYNGRVLAGLSMGIGGAAEPICTLIEQQQRVDLERARDTDRSLFEAAAQDPPDPADRFARLGIGDGTVAMVDGQEVAVHRDTCGALQSVSAICTHEGCTVDWNRAEQSWDCPCHGARFHADGRVMRGPATSPLEVIEITEGVAT
jgi:3-phenylpropionate/trans-cinnamate dioxygenase ferredoxin reductase subunit